MAFRSRSAAVVGGGVAAMVLSAGAVAWACTPYEAGSEAAQEYEAYNPPQSQDRPVAQPQPEPQPVAQAEAQPVTQAQPAPQAEPQLATKAEKPSTAVSSQRSGRRSVSASSGINPGSGPPAQIGAPQAPPPPAPVASPLPSMSGVAGDLWSGFSTSPSSSTRGPSLAAPTPTGGTGRGSEWALGVGLLGAGLAALGAGTGVSVVRRSRARVAAGPR